MNGFLGNRYQKVWNPPAVIISLTYFGVCMCVCWGGGGGGEGGEGRSKQEACGIYSSLTYYVVSFRNKCCIKLRVQCRIAYLEASIKCVESTSCDYFFTTVVILQICMWLRVC